MHATLKVLTGAVYQSNINNLERLIHISDTLKCKGFLSLVFGHAQILYKGIEVHSPSGIHHVLAISHSLQNRSSQDFSNLMHYERLSMGLNM